MYMEKNMENILYKIGEFINCCWIKIFIKKLKDAYGEKHGKYILHI